MQYNMLQMIEDAGTLLMQVLLIIITTVWCVFFIHVP